MPMIDKLPPALRGKQTVKELAAKYDSKTALVTKKNAELGSPGRVFKEGLAACLGAFAGGWVDEMAPAVPVPGTDATVPASIPIAVLLGGIAIGARSTKAASAATGIAAAHSYMGGRRAGQRWRPQFTSST